MTITPTSSSSLMSIHHKAYCMLGISQTQPVLSQYHPTPNSSSLAWTQLTPCTHSGTLQSDLYPARRATPPFTTLLHPCLKPFSASLCSGGKGKWEEGSSSSGNPKSAQKPTRTLCSHPGLCEALVTKEEALVACTVPGPLPLDRLPQPSRAC